METNKEIPTAEELIKDKFNWTYDSDPGRFQLWEQLIKPFAIEFAKINLSKQAEVIAENGWTKRDVGQLGEDIKIALRKNKLSTPELYLIIDECVKNLIEYREQSILQASEEYINNLK